MTNKIVNKHEWRKKEKALYIPKNKPEIIDVPAIQYISICGAGSPSEAPFSERIAALYALAYTIKMQAKLMEEKPVGHFDFTVYPLEGVWDISETAKQNFTGTINKNELVYKLMIRQPDYIDKHFFHRMFELAKANAIKKKRSIEFIEQVNFETIIEGKCIQMLHIGSYDNEKSTFDIMEAFAKFEGVTRLSKVHREIYLSDFRKVSVEKLKTTLRFKVSLSNFI